MKYGEVLFRQKKTRRVDASKEQKVHDIAGIA